MGIRQAMRLKSAGDTLLAAGAPPVAAARAPLSRWQPEGVLETITWNPIFDEPEQGVSKTMALSVPAVVKGRAILHSLITSRPLVAMRGAEVLSPDDQPTWLYRSDTGIAPQMRIADVLDDLIFHEASLLIVERGAPSSGAAFAPIRDAIHCPRERWGVNTDGYIEIDGQEVPAESVVVIYGPWPGLLTAAADAIRSAKGMRKAWSSRVDTPVPPIVMKQLEDNGMAQDEAQAYVNALNAARKKGGTMYVPFGHDVEFPSLNDDSGLFIEGRNAERIDFGNYFNLPSSLLDGSVSTASLTYSTQEGKRNEVFDYGLPYWVNPIENALSLDNVCPRGQRIRFDFSDLTAAVASPTGPTTED